VSPWSKTGGLGDVVGGLPIEMVKRGHKVMTVAPRCARTTRQMAFDESAYAQKMGSSLSCHNILSDQSCLLYFCGNCPSPQNMKQQWLW